MPSAVEWMNDSALLDELAQLSARHTGLHIPGDTRERFARMLRERATQAGFSSLNDYRNFLAGQPASGEWERIARAFTSSETFFFRDHGQFDLLRLRLLPELIAKHQHDKTLRLWSAGCASGEEAYSLAMLVDMLLPERDGWDILILGTDIDSQTIAKARRGHYGQWSFRMAPAAFQQRYFRFENNEWLLNELIRRMATFRTSNLVHDAFPDSGSGLHDMDLILCRNVFIYFEPAAVYAVAAKFAATLRVGGYLLTGHTEIIGHPVHELKSRLFAEGVVYQRAVPATDDVPALLRQPATRGGAEIARQRRAGGKPDAIAAAAEPAPSPPAPVTPEPELLLRQAHALADRGDYEQAEQLCRRVIASSPLAAAAYFLLAQLAQLRGDFSRARELLNKTLYLDSRFVAAYMELAALYKRTEDLPRMQALRHAALAIVRSMPGDARIEELETTAGELAEWLAQWAQETARTATTS